MVITEIKNGLEIREKTNTAKKKKVKVKKKKL
jgi:hypothetical protein